VELTLGELAKRLGAKLVGNPEHRIRACAPIDRADSTDISFVANPRYLAHLDETKAAAVIVAPGVTTREGLARLECDDPYFAFRQAMVLLHGFRQHPRPEVRATNVHAEARVAPDAVLHPGATVERGASVGARSVLYPGAYVGEGSSIGDDCILFPNAVVYDRCVIGNRVTLHANTVVGHDGFGYATHRGEHHKIPQAGVVVIEDDVELGAGCAIERAAMGETRIGRGTKFADLISIGHGTRIGSHCLLVSLVGVSGSVEVGDYVVLGGQVGIVGHLEIGKGAQVAAKAAVVGDVPAGARVAGVPAIDLDRAKRNALAGRDLYEMAKRLKALERELAELRARSAAP
jgi:UDP-3-O-[3-hydroxymyristoyl] glucosamine N-acyltransferase